jgi:enoyl-[acyl-carrier protein] reductase II
MIWVSGHKLASAVSNAGGLGLIGAIHVSEVLREHIRNVKKKLLNWSECSYVVSQC